MYTYIYIYKWHACPGSYIGYYENIFTSVYMYICIAHCLLLPVAYFTLPIAQCLLRKQPGRRMLTDMAVCIFRSAHRYAAGGAGWEPPAQLAAERGSTRRGATAARDAG